MRVYIKYEPVEGSVPEGFGNKMTIKIKLPASYLSSPILRVKELFVEHYNKKFAATTAVSDFTVVISDGRKLSDDAITSEYVHEYDEISIQFGAPPAKTTALAYAKLPETGGALESGVSARTATGDALVCRNYGCMKHFFEAENNATACRHHTGPPLFREGRKQWSCCPHVSGWDWDEFMAIEGCASGRHSTEIPAATFAQSPSVAAQANAVATDNAGSGAEASTPVVKSIADFNAANPDAPSSLTSLSKSMAADAPKKLVVREDGKKQCVHFGCQKFFADEENGAEACRHHTLPPVFHEGMKYWACCPGAKHMEFDEFLAQAGCAVSQHEAGTA